MKGDMGQKFECHRQLCRSLLEGTVAGWELKGVSSRERDRGSHWHISLFLSTG